MEFVNAARKWNKEVFGNVVRQKRILLARLAGIQRSLEFCRLRRLMVLEKELQCELGRILDVEESM